MTEPTVSQRLDGLDAKLVTLIHEFWSGARATGAKLQRIQAIAAILGDAPSLHARMARWPTDLARALRAMAEAGPATPPTHIARIAAAGIPDGLTVLETLLRRGVILPLEDASSVRLSPDCLRQGRANDLLLDVLPEALAPGPIEWAPTPVHAVPHAQLVSEGAPTAFAAQILRLTGLAARKRLKLNADRLPGAPLLQAAAKELGADPTLALVVALDGGALEVHQGVLAPPGYVDLTRLGPVGLLAALFDSFLLGGRWYDDAPPEAGIEEIRRPYGDRRSIDEHRHVRLVMAGALRRLETTGWVRADDLVDHALQLEPRVGFRLAYHGYSLNLPPNRPSEWSMQRRICLAALLRTFHAFGIVDLGTTGEVPDLPVHGGSIDYRADTEWYRTAAGPDRPPWKPVPTPWLVRVTPAGRHILDPLGAPQPDRIVDKRLVVNADFEILAPLDADPELLYRLGQATVALPSAPADRVRRWRLERERWLTALASGLQADAFLADLAAASPEAIPQNVLATVAGWTSQYGRFTLYIGHDLVEGAAPPRAIPVGPGWALAPSGTTLGTVEDVRLGERPCLVWEGYDTLVVDEAKGDITVPHRLGRIAHREAPGRWQLDRRKLLHVGAAEALETIPRLATRALTATQRARLKAWGGAVEAELQDLQILRLPDAAAFAAMPELSPHILGLLGPELLVVAPGERAAVVEALASLGARVSPKVTLGGPR